jgi:hypothetical protein
VTEGPIDPAQRRRAERRLLTALTRRRRRAPLTPDVRVDALVAELRAVEAAPGSRHRGRQPLGLTDAGLRRVLDEMVLTGALVRTGHRVRLPGPGPSLDPVMRDRLDALLATLRSAGASPPAAEAVASRLGIPSALLAQLRENGDLVQVAPRIDYPRETLDEITRRLDRLVVDRPLTVAMVRDELGTARRHAEAILRHRGRGSS